MALRPGEPEKHSDVTANTSGPLNVQLLRDSIYCIWREAGKKILFTRRKVAARVGLIVRQKQKTPAMRRAKGKDGQLGDRQRSQIRSLSPDTIARRMME